MDKFRQEFGLHVYFTGHAAGGLYYEGGGGANYLCLPQDPEWDNFRNGVLDGHIGGIEYEFFDTDNNVFEGSNTCGASLLDSPVPCAVCSVNSPSVLMVPARMDCHFISSCAICIKQAVSQIRYSSDRGVIC